MRLNQDQDQDQNQDRDRTKDKARIYFLSLKIMTTNCSKNSPFVDPFDAFPNAEANELSEAK